MRFVLALIAALLFSGSALAVQPNEVLKDPALEKRAREISAGLRCLVCQNQSIDDSDAQLAKDLRLLVRERLVAGDTNDQVENFLVQRYGEFVLLKPSFGAHTLLLWLTPALVLILGGIGAYAALRRPQATAAALDIEERKALEALLKYAAPLSELLGRQQGCRPSGLETESAARRPEGRGYLGVLRVRHCSFP